MTGVLITFAFVCNAQSYESSMDEEPPYVPSILLVEDDAALAYLEDKGVVILRHRADMVLALVPRAVPARSLEKARGVRRVERGRRALPAMDYARGWFGADRITSGEGLPHPYTGKGVVVGLCDTGIDPNHVAFLDSEGRSRVRKLVHYRETYGERTEISTPEEIAAWTTDNEDRYHGTHVLNILAGSYSGAGYQGMAPDADIVATSGEFYDVGILAACEDIIDYAKEVGKPAVINLSLSSYNGPHDGTSLFCRYMTELGKDAIVCMAAGNEGNERGSYRMDFTDNRTVWRTRIRNTSYDNFHIMGMADAWSADSRPVGVRVLVFDENVNGSVFEREFYGVDGKEFVVTISSDADPEFAKYLSGWVTIRGYVSELNGRWVTEAEYDTLCEEVSAHGGWGRRAISFEYTAAPGTHVDFTTDCQYSRFQNWSGWNAAGNQLSISDICTGDNVIAVGMYASRPDVPHLGEETTEATVKPGTVSQSSSYGKLIDGRVLPHTVAPGALTVSACSSYFVAAHPDDNNLAAVSEGEGKKYYWASVGGTSMAAPYTAGVIATWLEADPTLDVERALQIIQSTNTLECADPQNPRHGQGWLRPYDGLKEVLKNTGVVTGSIDCGEAKIVIRGDVADILNPGAEAFEFKIFTSQGVETLSERGSANIHCVRLSALNTGVYVWTLRLGSNITTGKFIR